MQHVNSINPKIRICILNWNGGMDLQECINSIQENKYNNYKITIIDNNSSDSSLSYISSDIEVIPLDHNYGFSEGYNKGIRKCISNNDEYLALLNYDTIVDQKFLGSISKNIKNEGKNYIYGVKILYHNNPNLIWYAGGKVDLPKGLISHVNIRQHNKDKENSLTDYITGCCMIIHKDIFFKLNGFDKRFFMYNEDVDLCLRANGIGVKCLYLSDPLILHKVSLSVGGNYSIKKISMKIKSSFQLYRKHYPIYKALVFFGMYVIRSTMSSIFQYR